MSRSQPPKPRVPADGGAEATDLLDAPLGARPAAAAPAERLRLLAFAGESLTQYPLPPAGAVVLGRGDEADIKLQAKSVSRAHARLALGSSVLLEDLGSANGTRLRGERLAAGAPAPVAVGESFEVGEVTLVLQREPHGARGSRPRQLHTHGYFEERLEDECARAQEDGTGFAVARLELQERTALARAHEVLARELQPVDVVASYAPGQLELLLLDGRSDLEGRMARLLAALGAAGAPARAGTARFPRDGRTPEALLARADPRPLTDGGRVVLADPAMKQLHALVERVARSDLSVLLTGETGVGKEIFARALHERSPRASAPFVHFNGAALAESLLESELFGHDKGAFTGADRARAGLIESAQGGTVFLDEVGELPLGTQAKLLRVLERKEILRLGEVRPRKVEVRFIAATNRDLQAECRAGRFRQDLYFRLDGLTLEIPPLRERRGEIRPLAESFLEAAAQRAGVARPRLGEEALALLESYAWPGNIRELKNVIERAVLLCTGEEIQPEHLPLEKLARAAGPDGRTDDAEKQRIAEALQACGGNQAEAAARLGISRRTLINRLDALGLPRPRKGRS